jgi:hypothetical protein
MIARDLLNDGGEQRGLLVVVHRVDPDRSDAPGLFDEKLQDLHVGGLTASGGAINDQRHRRLDALEEGPEGLRTRAKTQLVFAAREVIVGNQGLGSRRPSRLSLG